MSHQDSIPEPVAKFPNVHLIDGTSTNQSYAVVARRGTIFLGVKFSGLMDGARFGLPRTTYMHARLRSARVVKLAALLDITNGPDKIFDLSVHQLSLDDAWPNLSFEKVDAERASLEIGLFIQVSLIKDTAAVIARVQQGDLFRKLINYVIGEAGVENCLSEASSVSGWLAKPSATIGTSPTMADRLWTAEDLGKFLGLAPKTVQALASRDPERLPARVLSMSSLRWVPSVCMEWAVSNSSGIVQNSVEVVPNSGGARKKVS